ncbi:multicomponent Na+:H+ antiporter subunit E [Halobiforma haloterrestris]|uniref:Multicomponent Na+:H+ antiporter subunit E n=1 Tax=Natronobacterium haloterrestre TaxID=148448 RepID=A0A1I1K529_NATHA|nr:Na+/H+ antiporter subunit E [Halobiforma haloterrestris]SFC55826.1 multicomponent Na+:H+ antiporter subunit E [Halobiforma haloterrestris]
MKVRTWPVAGVVFAVLWIFVRGIELESMTLFGQFLEGLAVGLPIAFVFRRLYAKRITVSRGRRVKPALLYLLAFVWELLRANVDMVYRVVAPSMPIEPEVVLVPLRAETDLAITLLANSVTLTPGTVALDYDEDVNALYVHAVDGRDPAAIVAPIRRWEDYALEIFDEDAAPEDPARQFVVSGGERDKPEPDERAGGYDD